MRCVGKISASGKMIRPLALAAAVGCLSLTGCRSWLDPSETARDKGARLVVPILRQIDPIDEEETEFGQAQDVQPRDLQVVGADYMIGANDLITVSIFDLTAGGVETVRTARVSETGMLSLPMLSEPVKAAGLTELQLQGAIAQKYKEAGILEKAQVSVTVTEARQRTFSILGAVARPGQYPMVEADFRVLNALVLAGDTTTTQIENLYVIRKVRSEIPTERPATGETPQQTPPQPQQTQPADLAPRGAADVVKKPVLAMTQDLAPTTTPAQPASPAGEDEKTYTIEGKTLRLGATQPAADTGIAAPPAAAGDAPAAQPPANPAGAAGEAAPAEAAPQPAFEFGAAMASGEEQRVIRVPLQQLRNGDLRYNIVIRPGDTILVPVPTQGFYYMGGHVGAPGVYSLAGQKLTLKQAVISARMLDALAVPQKTDVIRRIGNNELFVRVNLAQVFDGKQPDILLKPNDVVMVGTDFYPPFLAAVRGAFRLTYGFGFLYDRNYAPAQEGLRNGE